MSLKTTGLDWLRILLVLAVVILNYWLWASLWIGILWAFVTWLLVFRLDGREAGYLALGALILTPGFLFFELEDMAELLAVNVFYLMGIMVLVQLISDIKLPGQNLGQKMSNLADWLQAYLQKLPRFVWVGGILLGVGILITGRYFFRVGTPHNAFLDLGGISVWQMDIWWQYSRGWMYQFSIPFNTLTSSLVVLYTNLLSRIMGDFFLGIKLYQFLSLLVGMLGMMSLIRLLLAKHSQTALGLAVQILAALIYGFNPFFLSVLNGVVEFGVAYALLPWIIYLWIRLLHHKPVGIHLYYHLLILGVITAFTTLASSITLFFTNSIPLGVIMLGMIIIQKPFSWSNFSRYLKFLAVIWGIVILVGLHFLIPTFFGYRQNQGLLTEAQTEERITPFVKDFYSPNLIEVLSLHNKEGIVSEEIGYNLRDIPWRYRIIWLIWSCLAIVSILWVKQNWVILPIWFGSALAGYLALGYSQSWLYRVLNSYFPYFWGLRTPGRFMMIYALGVAILGSLVWYYLFQVVVEKKWYLAGLALSGLSIFVIIISARYQAVKIYTFWTIPSISIHYPGIDKAKNSLDKLNPNLDYRVLDLTRDDDGSWHHTRLMAANQRIFHKFEQVLLQSPRSEWLDILAKNNVKYIVVSGYDDYCEDRFENDRNLISCYLLLQEKDLVLKASTLAGYRIYLVPKASSYVEAKKFSQGFSYSPEIKTQAKELPVVVAEPYSPQFQWRCQEKMIATKPEQNGLLQAAILPANSDCVFRYHQSLMVRISQIISYGLIILTVLATLGLIMKRIYLWVTK